MRVARHEVVVVLVACLDSSGHERAHSEEGRRSGERHGTFRLPVQRSPLSRGSMPRERRSQRRWPRREVRGWQKKRKRRRRQRPQTLQLN